MLHVLCTFSSGSCSGSLLPLLIFVLVAVPQPFPSFDFAYLHLQQPSPRSLFSLPPSLSPSPHPSASLRPSSSEEDPLFADELKLATLMTQAAAEERYADAGEGGRVGFRHRAREVRCTAFSARNHAACHGVELMCRSQLSWCIEYQAVERPSFVMPCHCGGQRGLHRC